VQEHGPTLCNWIGILTEDRENGQDEENSLGHLVESAGKFGGSGVAATLFPLFGSFFSGDKKGFSRGLLNGPSRRVGAIPEGKGEGCTARETRRFQEGGSRRAKQERVACISDWFFFRGGLGPTVGGATRWEWGGEEEGEG
jgi:hypothetical protein